MKRGSEERRNERDWKNRDTTVALHSRINLCQLYNIFVIEDIWF